MTTAKSKEAGSSSHAKPGNPVFDVSKPGESAAPATSRPVIIKHRQLMNDPMMKDDEATSPEASKKQPPQPSTLKKVVQPSITTKQAEAESEHAAATTASPNRNEAQMAPATQKKSIEEATVDALADQMVRKPTKKETQEDKEKRAEIERYIQEKTYFVPVAQVKGRRRRRLLAVLLLLMLLAIGGLLALDAELIDVGLVAPFDVI